MDANGLDPEQQALLASIMGKSPQAGGGAAFSNDVDKNLYDKENVITSDAIILDNCKTWFNLTSKAIRTEIGDYPFIKIL